MSIKKHVYSYFENKDVNATSGEFIELTLGSNRNQDSYSMLVETVDGLDFEVDIGDGNIIISQSSRFYKNYSLDRNTGTSTKLYIRKTNLKSLGLITAFSHSFSFDDLPSLPNLKKLELSKECVYDLFKIPQSITYLNLRSGEVVGGYPTTGNNNFLEFNRVVISPDTGTALTSSDVDNLIIDMDDTVTWIGNENAKALIIIGNSEPRTSASDAAVTSLQNKGVTVTTNI